MDILDIDEALKDDSYIFLADKTNDDISNILQQWKTNNQEQSQSQQPTNEQAYKLNSKTFTRPKRRSQAATSLETQFTHLAQSQNNTMATSNSGMLSLEIGGLVTNMHKSFLQDTSPPSSICSSMNNGHMNNSLITSADFTNLNFLQSINSMETIDGTGITHHNLTTTTALMNDGGYTLSDMIRDRKALESLSMSGDGTLIKDSHIGQIDDISLTTLSKTTSACSTMDNSTDSVSMSNEQQMLAQVKTQPPLGKTMVLCEEMIGDTTVSLVESLTSPTTEFPGEWEKNATFKRPTAVQTPLLNETQLLTGRNVNNTFSEGCLTPEAAHCETPENVEKKLSSIHMQSTPLTTTSARVQNYNNNNNHHKQFNHTPKSHGEIINISPIVSTTPHNNFNSRQLLNHTFEPLTEVFKELQLDGERDGFDNQNFVLSKMELLEQIEQPLLDATYNMSVENKQNQCVVELAKVDVEFIAQQDDEELFEHMLAELGKVNVLNAEQLKMQKSLDSIKRRFQKDEEHTTQGEQQQPVEDIDHVTPTSPQLVSTHSHSNIQSSGERLLSRRSRLYDDVNLSAMQNSNGSTVSCNSTSFIVHRREEDPPNISQVGTSLEETAEHEVDVQQQVATDTESSGYKVAGRRNRDRDRFKTIKITEEMRARNEQLSDIIVPCIDDERHHHQTLGTVEQDQGQQSPPTRLSRHDQTSFNNMNESARNAKASNNYLTYKKPKETSWMVRQRQNLPESDQNKSTQPRSLSRPRYIGDLQKLTSVSKAASAGAGLNATTAVNVTTTAAEVVPTFGDFGGLTSPMGIKSKSFHNLSSNLGHYGGASGCTTALVSRPSVGGAIRRPSIQANKLISGPKAMQEKEDKSSVFKVPKSISGLRAPLTAGAKRATANGLARPSSGFYSLSVKAAGESETPESLSSASSRCSLHCKDVKQNDPFDTHALSLKLTQVTTGATGIPKPSGLRQPTQMKRSGLPRPSTIVRR
ncbi:uncharacterized protein LOC6558034 [Drosophila grimshawi]|uniref:GH17202 n=1 Tax=Drosophila grimshawi TaxID=7222 RepID=B4J1V0_DROGR|nr:uncharacterized protein LOC6558034 [Drosophila grimshawi]EDV98030.1 GH17202 [Drosophila grimshawi]